MKNDAAGGNADNTDPLWTTTQAAAYLHRPPGTLGQWRHKGTGPPWYKLVGIVMYRRSELESWLAGQTRTITVGAASRRQDIEPEPSPRPRDTSENTRKDQ